MRHEWKMVAGRALPLLLVFVLPLFGFGEGTALVVFLVLMFGCHQFMMGGHTVWRELKSSGGVSASWPGHKGHPAEASLAAAAGFESSGRSRLPGATMTQPRVVGSWRRTGTTYSPPAYRSGEPRNSRRQRAEQKPYSTPR
jgi:hypothetical protein